MLNHVIPLSSISAVKCIAMSFNVKMSLLQKAFSISRSYEIDLQSRAAGLLHSRGIFWGFVPEVTPLASTTTAYVALRWTSNGLLTELLIKNLTDKHISDRRQECWTVRHRQKGTWGRIIVRERLKVCFLNVFREQGVCVCGGKRIYLCPCCALRAVKNGAV